MDAIILLDLPTEKKRAHLGGTVTRNGPQRLPGKKRDWVLILQIDLIWSAKWTASGAPEVIEHCREADCQDQRAGCHDTGENPRAACLVILPNPQQQGYNNWEAEDQALKGTAGGQKQ